MLDVQYRMNPEISSFPSFQFYENRINNGENVQSPNHVGTAALVDGSPYIFMAVEGAEEKAAGGSYRNHAEARCVVDLILQLREVSSRSNEPGPWHSSARVRVITFYQAQVSYLKKLLKERGAENVVVATVDSSQGCEADIVMVSFVRSNRTSSAGFLSDDRRMNVALTRAKYQLICVGNVECLSGMTTTEGGTLRDLAEDAMKRNVVRRRDSSRLPLSISRPKALVDGRLDVFYGPPTKNSCSC